VRSGRRIGPGLALPVYPGGYWLLRSRARLASRWEDALMSSTEPAGTPGTPVHLRDAALSLPGYAA